MERLLDSISPTSKVGVYSIDLSAATDRLPIRMQVLVMKYLLSLFMGLSNVGMAGYFASH